MDLGQGLLDAGTGLIGGILGGVSQGATNAFQAEQHRQDKEFSADQAQANRQWQQGMSETAHQRESADLMKAGLNPMLAVMKGSNGAPMGGGAMGSPGAPAQNGGVAGAAMSGAMGTMQLRKDLENRDAATALTKVQKAIADNTEEATGYSARQKELDTEVREKQQPTLLWHAGKDYDMKGADAALKRVPGSAVGSAAGVVGLVQDAFSEENRSRWNSKDQAELNKRLKNYTENGIPYRTIGDQRNDF